MRAFRANCQLLHDVAAAEAETEDVARRVIVNSVAATRPQQRQQ